jgi:hypothetical protein
MKLRNMWWAVHVARMVELRSAYKILDSRPRRKWEANIRMDVMGSSGSVCGPVAGSYVHGNKPSGSVKGGKFID